jgi:hypothetical protein
MSVIDMTIPVNRRVVRLNIDTNLGKPRARTFLHTPFQENNTRNRIGGGYATC